MSRPAVSTDFIIGLGGAAVLAVGLAASRGAMAGGTVGAVAALGVVARWGPAPLLTLAAAAYLSLFPDGLPYGQPVGRENIAPNLLDLLTAAAAVVYVAGHYRYLRADADEPTADELAGLFGGSGAAVLTGLVVLLIVTRLRPDYDNGPLRFVRVEEFAQSGDKLFARALMLVGLLGSGALAAAMSLWLARLNRLTPPEARQLLQDTGWQEGRRELARLETWRAAANKPSTPKPATRPRSGCMVALGIGLVLFGGSFLGFMYLLARFN